MTTTTSVNRGGSLNISTRPMDSESGKAYKEFNVKFDKNVTIYDCPVTPTRGSHVVRTSIYNGNVKTSNTRADKENFETLSISGYMLINNIRKLDGNEKDFSDKDIQLALQKKDELGLEELTYDKSTGVLKVETKDGRRITLDFETDEEIAAEQEAKAQKEAEAKAEKEKKESSWQYKFARVVGGFLDRLGIEP